MLLLINIKDYNARKVVQYFEVLKEKAPELVIPFDELLVVGRAYRDIGEHERAYLVWRAIAEASYLEDARVGEVLRQRGKTLEGIAYLLDLWREYPDTASIESDFFGLSQVLARHAGKAITDPALRTELADAGVDPLRAAPAGDPADPGRSSRSRPRTRWPTRRAWPWSATSSSSRTSRPSSSSRPRFAKLYPKSTFLDSFQYSEALGEFHLGQYDRAIEVAEAIAKATYKDANGRRPAEPEQVAGALHPRPDLRRPPRAGARRSSYYKQVAERFTDAAGAVKALTRKDLKLPEVSVVRPGRARRSPRPAAGLRAIAVQQPDAESRPRTDSPTVDARLPQHRRGRREGLPGRPDAALPDPAQPRRDRRDRPGRDHAAVRDDDQARRRRGLRRQGSGRSTCR